MNNTTEITETGPHLALASTEDWRAGIARTITENRARMEARRRSPFATPFVVTDAKMHYFREAFVCFWHLIEEREGDIARAMKALADGDDAAAFDILQATHRDLRALAVAAKGDWARAEETFGAPDHAALNDALEAMVAMGDENILRDIAPLPACVVADLAHDAIDTKPDPAR